MKMRLTLLIVLAVVGSVMALVPLGTYAEAQEYQVKKDLKNIPVEGALASGGTFVGKLTILGLTFDETGALLVTGILDGTATSSTGTVTDVKKQLFTAPVIAFQDGSAEPVDTIRGDTTGSLGKTCT